jgi:hypothetical protein
LQRFKIVSCLVGSLLRAILWRKGGEEDEGEAVRYMCCEVREGYYCDVIAH